MNQKNPRQIEQNPSNSNKEPRQIEQKIRQIESKIRQIELKIPSNWNNNFKHNEHKLASYIFDPLLQIIIRWVAYSLPEEKVTFVFMKIN